MKMLIKTALTLCVIPLLVNSTPSHGESAAKSGWITLFDGKSTDAFRGYKKQTFPTESWTVADGTLKSIPGNAGVDLMTKEEFKDFELTLEWKISPGGNSGVIYRVSENYDHSYKSGAEMQVLDDTKHNDGKNAKTSAGALYALIAPQGKKLKPVGEWNEVRLVVKDNNVQHWLNGVKVVEYKWGSPELKQLIAESKFKSMPGFAKNDSGHICLQHHHDEVWYRNVKIRRL